MKKMKKDLFEIYKSEKNVTILVLSREMKKSEALSAANRFLKKRLDDLCIVRAWIGDDGLYFKKVEGGAEAWAVYKKSRRGDV